MSQETIGARLKRVAKTKHQWSLHDLAEKLDVSYETLRKWVIGSTAPNRQRTTQVANLLGITEEYVTYGAAASATAPSPTTTAEITESEWAHLEDLRFTRQQDREAIIEATRVKAEEIKAIRREVMQSFGIKGDAPPDAGNHIPAAPPIDAKDKSRRKLVKVVSDSHDHNLAPAAGPAPKKSKH